MTRRWLAVPALHFAVLGALVAVLRALLAPGDGDGAGSAASEANGSDEALLVREARSLGLERSDAVIRRRLLRNLRFVGEGAAGGESADFEEALALGLERSDLVVRRRLVQRFELSAEAWARATEPSEDELARELARDPARFTQPARVRLSHVFVSRDRHGSRLAAADRALGLRLAGVAPARGVTFGDPFLLGNQLGPRSQEELARDFGAEFARHVMALAPGRWSGPIASSYGLHRVFVHELLPERRPALAQVRGAVREAVFAARAEQVRDDWLRRLRGEGV